MSPIPLQTRLGCFLVTALFAGCGGGNDPGFDPRANAPTLTVAVADQDLATVQATNFALTTGSIFRSITDQFILQNHAFERLTLPTPPDAVVTDAVVTTEAQCTANGQTTPGTRLRQLRDTNNDGMLSAGENLSESYDGCFFPDVDLTLTGSLDATVDALDGIPGTGGAPLTMQGTLTFNTLEFFAPIVITPDDPLNTPQDPDDPTQQPERNVINLTPGNLDGRITFELTTADQVVYDIRTSAPQLLTGDAGQPEQLGDFVLQVAVDRNLQQYRYQASGHYRSDNAAGLFAFETTEPFTGTRNDFPDSGRLAVVGQNGSYAILTALSNQFARIEFNGNAIILPWVLVISPNGLSAIGENNTETDSTNSDIPPPEQDPGAPQPNPDTMPTL